MVSSSTPRSFATRRGVVSRASPSAVAFGACADALEPEAPASFHAFGDPIDRDRVLARAAALALPLAPLVAAGTAATAAPRPAPPAPLLRRSTLHAASPGPPGPPGPPRRPPPPPSPRRCGAPRGPRAPRAPPPRPDPPWLPPRLFPFVFPLNS